MIRKMRGIWRENCWILLGNCVFSKADMITFLSKTRKLMETACIIFHISEILSSPKSNHQIIQFFHVWRIFCKIKMFHWSFSSWLDNLTHEISTNWVFFMEIFVFEMVKISSNLSAWIAESLYLLMQFLSIGLVISALIIQFMNWEICWGDGPKIWENDKICSNLGKWFYFFKKKVNLFSMMFSKNRNSCGIWI